MIDLAYPLNKANKREPNAKQFAFHTSKQRYRAYLGAIGAGKTLCGCLEVLKLAAQMPGSLGLVGANTYPQLRDATQRTFFQICPPQAIKDYHKQENRLTLINGSEILFRSFDDYSKFQGLELAYAYMDEAAEAPESVFDMLAGRLRQPGFRADQYKLFVTSNPNGHNWLWRKFVQNPTPDHFIVTTTTYENKENLPDGYIETLEKNYSADWVKRFVYGSFDTFSGQIFSEYNDELHTCQPFHIPNHWYKFRTVDFGWSHPTAVLWIAEDETGNLFVYRELYKKELSAYDLADEIKALSPGEKYEYTIGDTSGARIDQTSGESVFTQLYEKAGISVLPANKQNKLARIDRLRFIFKQRRIKIFNTCINLIRELPGYQWESPKHEVQVTKQRPLKINDDCIDALLYLVSSRPDYYGMPKKPPENLTPEEMMLEARRIQTSVDYLHQRELEAAKESKDTDVNVYY